MIGCTVIVVTVVRIVRIVCTVHHTIVDRSAQFLIERHQFLFALQYVAQHMMRQLTGGRLLLLRWRQRLRLRRW